MKSKTGELIALRPEHARADPGVGVAVRAPESPTAFADFQNVVPFMRPRAPDAIDAPAVVLPTDVARLPAAGSRSERARLLAFAAISLALHSALFAVFWREPDPLASIGMEVISVEIVVGATAPAGIAVAPGENEQQAVAATETPPLESQQQAEQKATEQPQNVPVAPEEKAPERTATQERPADEPKPLEKAEAPPEEPVQADPKPSVAMVETPTPDTATAVPREAPPDTMDFTLLPQPEEKPVERKPEKKPVQAAPPKPVKNAAPAKERTRIAAPTRERAEKQAKASAPSSAANNVGVGRSDHDTNYRGLVAAHLARYKQYPSDARSRGDQGTAAVTFSLDGGGRVTSVRLARGSGVSSIDGEVTAMVRRASPFPAPPSGRGASFTVPVSFRLN